MPPRPHSRNDEFQNIRSTGIPRTNERSSESRDRDVSQRRGDSSPEEGEVSSPGRDLSSNQRLSIPQGRDTYQRRRDLEPAWRSLDVQDIDSYRPQKDLESSWRSRDAGSIDSYRPQRHPGVPSHYDNNTSRTIRTNRTRDTGIGGRAFFDKKYGRPEVYSQEHFRPGTIIHANLIEEAWDCKETESNAHTIVEGKNGEKIFSKGRFLIVVAQNASCYTTVPVFTHGGKGLSYRHVKKEHVSIRDHRIHMADFKQLSEHAPLITHYLKEPTRIMDVATAWVAYPMSKPYSLPVKLVGQLEEASIKQLTKLYQQLMGVKHEFPTATSQAPDVGKRGVAEQEKGRVESVKLSDNDGLHAAVERETDAVEKLTLPTPSRILSLGKGAFAEPEKGRIESVKLSDNVVLHAAVDRETDPVEKQTLSTLSRNSSLGKRRSAEPETGSVKSLKLNDTTPIVETRRDALEKMTLKSTSSQGFAGKETGSVRSAKLSDTTPTYSAVLKGGGSVKRRALKTNLSMHANLLSGHGAIAEKREQYDTQKGRNIWGR